MNGIELKKLRIDKGLTQGQLANITGIPQGTIGRVESTGQDIKKVDMLNKFLEVFKNDKSEHEEFTMDSPRSSVFDKQRQKESSTAKNSKIEFVGVPMYNIPASASLVEMYGDATDVKVIGHLTIPGATKDSFALPVHGHSMYPTLENGSWCVLRPLIDKTDIEWGEIYYIEYGDYRMYKRLLKAEDEDSVILWSDNQSELIMNKPKYSSKTIKKEKIRRLCLLTDILKKPNY